MSRGAWRAGVLTLALGMASAWSAAGQEAGPPPSGAVPAYTNEDLERVRPRRAETGVESQPAFAPGEPAPGKAPGSSRAESRGEAYWRREAARVRQKVDGLRERIDELELRIASRAAQARVRAHSDAQIVGWRRRIGALETRMRELEGDLEDRARRERALPGWLR